MVYIFAEDDESAGDEDARVQKADNAFCTVQKRFSE